MLTGTGRALAGGAVSLLVGGVLFGNAPVVAAGAILLAFASFSGLPRAPEVVRTVRTRRIERGGRFEVEVEARLPRGFGLVEIHQHLPEEFELREGANLHVLALGWRARIERFAFTVRAPKRGEYELPPVGVCVRNALGLARTRSAGSGEPVPLVVEPRPQAARIPRGLRARARRPFPEGDLARMGAPTNDFKELREYAPGDPPRRINWKATARRIESGASEVPLVNETEREGKKTVWLLVDGHPRLSAGTNLEDAREAAADAAVSVAQAYLRRGYQVGLRIARSGRAPVLRAASGEGQIRRMREMLAKLGEGESPALAAALDEDMAHLRRERPLVVLVTRLCGDDPDLLQAFTRIGALAHRRNLVGGLVLDVGVPPAASEAPHERATQAVLDAQRARLHAAARAAGLRVVGWLPEREPLAAVLLRGRVV